MPDEKTKAEKDPSVYDNGEITVENLEDAFTFKQWDVGQVERGKVVRAALVAAAEVILTNVPRCPMRTRAINNLVDARMMANAAITFDKKQ